MQPTADVLIFFFFATYCQDYSTGSSRGEDTGDKGMKNESTEMKVLPSVVTRNVSK